MGDVWMPEEIRYLEKMSRTCQELSNRFRILYNEYKRKQIKYKLPTIVLGSILGLASFGSSQFGEANQQKISIGVGAVNIVISIVSSIEAFLKLGENMSGSLVASNSYQKLKEQIDVELALPIENRTSSGIIFLRECYAEYQKIGELAPAVLTKNRYITEEYSKVQPFLHTPHHILSRTLSYDEKRKRTMQPSFMTIGVDDVQPDMATSSNPKRPKIIDLY